MTDLHSPKIWFSSVSLSLKTGLRFRHLKKWQTAYLFSRLVMVTSGKIVRVICV